MVELILNDQITFPFELRICSEQSRIEEFPNNLNRHYHLEEILPDDSEQNKDSVLIPVAHYSKVISKGTRKKHARIHLSFRKIRFKLIYKISFHSFFV